MEELLGGLRADAFNNAGKPVGACAPPGVDGLRDITDEDNTEGNSVVRLPQIHEADLKVRQILGLVEESVLRSNAERWVLPAPFEKVWAAGGEFDEEIRKVDVIGK